MTTSASTLYSIVEAYSALGDHRTGTAADEKTANWFAGLLSNSGAVVEKQGFTFDRFEHQTTLSGTDGPIRMLPLFYRWTGQCGTTNLSVKHLFLDHEDGAEDPIPALCQQAISEGFDALVLATGGPEDSLVAMNRAPDLVGDLPVILIAGQDFERACAGSLSLQHSARLVPCTADNVIARFGNRTEAERIVLTTPISGWFGCAGERGTGIAVLVGLIDALREHHAFTVIGASGHELMYLGGDHAASAFPADPDFVLHLGSCVATSEGSLDANLNAPSGLSDTVRAALNPLSVNFRQPVHPADECEWVGESRCWAGRAKSMLSIAGTSPDFHTPEDTPERATSPERLELALGCIKQAVAGLVSGTP